MIERARLPRRRKKYPVRHYTLLALEWVLIFSLLFYYAAFFSRIEKVRIVDVSVEGAHALSTEPIASIARAPLGGTALKYIRRDNAILYPTSGVKEEILSYDRRVAGVNVVTDGPQVKVSIREWEPVFRYCIPPVGYGVSNLATSSILELPTKALDEAHATTTLDTTASGTPALIDLGSEALHLLPPEPLVSTSSPGQQSHSCYWVNADGMAFAKSPEYSGSPLLTFIEGDSSKFEGQAGSTPTPIGSIVLTDDVRNWGVEMRKELFERGSIVYNYELMPLGDVRILTGAPYAIIVSIRNKPSDEARLFATAIRQFSKNPEDTPKEYLDLRAPTKIYYK